MQAAKRELKQPKNQPLQIKIEAQIKCEIEGMLQSENQKLAVNFEILNELHAFQMNSMQCHHMSGRMH